MFIVNFVIFFFLDGGFSDKNCFILFVFAEHNKLFLQKFPKKEKTKGKK